VAVRLLVLAALLIAGLAEGREVAGVRMPDTVELQGRRLALAHMALKERLFFNVYVWGLYMEQIPQAESEAIAANHLKRVRAPCLWRGLRGRRHPRQGLRRRALRRVAAAAPLLRALSAAASAAARPRAWAKLFPLPEVRHEHHAG
jgi:hypothetical protein